MTEQIVVQLNPDVPPTGSDLGVVNAARKSFGRRSEWEFESHGARGKTVQILKEKDKRLLEFLARGMTADDFEDFLYNFEGDVPKDYKSQLTELLWQWRNTPTHDTPFNHGFFSFEVKAPIFVARHLVKHEYLIMSEYSRRYITDDVEFYQPNWRGKAEDVKQGSGGELPTLLGKGCNIKVGVANGMAMELYEDLITNSGVAPEQARMVLPQSLMTSWTWSGSFGAFANMCKLRLSKDTQYETRMVAEKVYEELKKQFPISAPLLVEGVV
tara:strand:+ start:45 stop:854 length:810 start_codon:yes stop_codon:yes gene_type:complete